MVIEVIVLGGGQLSVAFTSILAFVSVIVIIKIGIIVVNFLSSLLPIF